MILTLINSQNAILSTIAMEQDSENRFKIQATTIVDENFDDGNLAAWDLYATNRTPGFSIADGANYFTAENGMLEVE